MAQLDIAKLLSALTQNEQKRRQVLQPDLSDVQIKVDLEQPEQRNIQRPQPVAPQPIQPPIQPPAVQLLSNLKLPQRPSALGVAGIGGVLTAVKDAPVLNQLVTRSGHSARVVGDFIKSRNGAKILQQSAGKITPALLKGLTKFAGAGVGLIAGELIDPKLAGEGSALTKQEQIKGTFASEDRADTRKARRDLLRTTPNKSIQQENELRQLEGLFDDEQEVEETVTTTGSPDLPRGHKGTEGVEEQPQQTSIMEGIKTISGLAQKSREDIDYLTTEEVGAKPNKRTIAGITKALEALPPLEEFEEAAKAGIAKRGWDRRAARTIERLFGEDAGIGADLVAATSQQQQVKPNWRSATTIYRDWIDAGRPIDDASLNKIISTSGSQGLAGREANIRRALRGEKLQGPKILPWSMALRGDPQAVTNDLWIGRFIGLDEGVTPTTAQHRALTIRFRQTAERLGWEPREASETIWSFVKFAHEHGALEKTEISPEFIQSIQGANLKDVSEYSTLLIDPEMQSILRDINIEQGVINDTIKENDQDLARAVKIAETQDVNQDVLTRSAKRLQENAIRATKEKVATRTVPADPKAFNESITKADAKSKYKGFVTIYSPEKYAEMDINLNAEGSAGYAITPDNEIASVFNDSGVKNVGEKMVKEAIRKGGNHLYAFEGYLTKKYGGLDFVEDVRFKWDDAQAPKNWDYEEFGRPDVVHMNYKGKIKKMGRKK